MFNDLERIQYKQHTTQYASYALIELMHVMK